LQWIDATAEPFGHGMAHAAPNAVFARLPPEPSYKSFIQHLPRAAAHSMCFGQVRSEMSRHVAMSVSVRTHNAQAKQAKIESIGKNSAKPDASAPAMHS